MHAEGGWVRLCRNPDTLARLNEAERALKKKQEEEYINMDLCNEQKEEGNRLFKEHKCAPALPSWTACTARGPASFQPRTRVLRHLLMSGPLQQPGRRAVSQRPTLITNHPQQRDGKCTPTGC